MSTLDDWIADAAHALGLPPESSRTTCGMRCWTSPGMWRTASPGSPAR